MKINHMSLLLILLTFSTVLHAMENSSSSSSSESSSPSSESDSSSSSESVILSMEDSSSSSSSGIQVTDNSTSQDTKCLSKNVKKKMSGACLWLLGLIWVAGYITTIWALITEEEIAAAAPFGMACWTPAFFCCFHGIRRLIKKY